MTDNKIKVKDLSDELGMPSKELLPTIRDLNIPAKAANSTVTAEDAERIKDRVQMLRDPNARKDASPSVVVRRRKPHEGNQAAKGDAPKADAPKAEAKPTEGQNTKPAPKEKAHNNQGGNRKKRDAQQAPVAARIIRRPDEVQAEPAPQVRVIAPAAPKPEAVAKVVEAPKSEAVTKVMEMPKPEVKADVKTEGKSTPETKPQAKPEAKPAEAKTEVKAENSKPQSKADVKTEAKADIKAENKADVKAEAPKADAKPVDNASQAQNAGDNEEGDSRRKKKKRRQPEVVTPAVRVISRPDPAAIPTARVIEPAPQRPQGGRDGYQPREGRDGRDGQQREYRPRGEGQRDFRPRGEGQGQRDGQRDFRPRGEGGYQPRDGQGQREGGFRPRGEGGFRPRDGQAPREGGFRPRPEGGFPPRDGAPREGGFRPRPEGGFPPRDGAPREGGFRPRPDDGRDGRDSRDGARPARPAGGRPGGGAPRPAGGGMPMPLGDSQSKKKRQKGRRTVDFGNEGGRGRDDGEMIRSPRNRGKRKKEVRPQATQPLKAIKRKIKIDEAIRVADMAHQMGLKANEIIKMLFGLGVMATINQSLDIDTATVIAGEFGYEVEKVGFSEDDYLVPKEEDAPEMLKKRPPVVTIMGHVDHGKTSLLDAIRSSNVTSGEAGGITQHIGAYHVQTSKGEIVFLDTPGHEAFTAMRARGAQITDLVVLVVAADDGVMEQTREAVNHSKAAGVPIMVAVNKMDKEGANPERVIRELSEMGLVAEDWGGDTIFAQVSAKTRQGLDELLELIALQAEVLELQANPNKAARGHVVEAKLDKGRGPLATVLVQEGTLRLGDAFVCGVFAGRVRAMFNDQGAKVMEAGPSTPVEVQGFDGVVEAGEEFVTVTDDKLARRIAEARAIKQRERELAKESKVTLETFLARRADDAEAQTLNLVLKSDVQGSLEAISEAVRKLSTEKVKINIIHGGAGAITESDILLASASEAIIIGFNVRPTSKIKEIAERENVDIRFYDIIYKLTDEIKSAMQGMLAPVQRESYLGQVEVRETFSVPKVGVIAGCFVADGKILRNAGVRLLRDGVVVYTGKISSLKRFKDDAREVQKGYECGVGLENYNDIKVKDIIEAFEIVEEAATL